MVSSTQRRGPGARPVRRDVSAHLSSRTRVGTAVTGNRCASADDRSTATLTSSSSPASWCLSHRTQLGPGLVRSLEQPLQRVRALAQVDAVLLLEPAGDVVHQAPVEAVAAQVAAARRGRTSTTSSPKSRRLTSKIRPPGSKTCPVSCCFLSGPEAGAAAVGSLTCAARRGRPYVRLARGGAVRWAPLKWAGTVMTASVTLCPRRRRAFVAPVW